MSKIIDFHNHAYPSKVARKAIKFLEGHYKVPYQGEGTIEDLKRSAKDAGVDYLLIHSVATKPSQVKNINDWVAEHVGSNIFGFGTIHPYYEHIEEELARIRELGLLGIKLHPDFQGFYSNDPCMDAIYKNIEGELPLLIHAGDEQSDFSAPQRIADIIDRFPRLTVIAAHLGGYKRWDEAEEYLIGKNLYIDTSSAIWGMPAERAVKIIRKHGVEHVLFGTDYPLVCHRNELQRFEDLGLTESEKKLILFENAKKLLGLDIN